MSKMKSFIFDLFDDNKLTINNSTQVQNAEFWTTDRDAYLSFGISRQGFVIDKAIINLYNKSDKSLLIDAPMTILNNEARFKVNSDVMSHFGKWSAQVIFNDTHTSPTVDFEILRALGSGTPDRIGLIHEWEKLNNEVKSFVAEIEGFTLDQFVELKMGEELANLETNYATRLTGLEQKDNQLTAQLAQIPGKSEARLIERKKITKQHPTIVGYGDSNTRYYEGDRGSDGSITHAYTSWLERFITDYPDFFGSKIINAGYSGQTLGYGLTNYAENVTAHNADVVVIGFGTNNIKDSSNTLDSYISNMTTMIDRLLGDSIVPIILGIPWFSQSYAGAEMQARIEPWNIALRDLCVEKNVEFIDVYTMFPSAQSNTWFNERSTPQRHYSQLAEKVLAEEIFERIKKLSAFEPNKANFIQDKFNYRSLDWLNEYSTLGFESYNLGLDVIDTVKIPNGGSIKLTLYGRYCVSFYPRANATARFSDDTGDVIITNTTNDGIYYPIKRAVSTRVSPLPIHVVTLTAVDGDLFVRKISMEHPPYAPERFATPILKELTASSLPTNPPIGFTVFCKDLLKEITYGRANVGTWTDHSGYLCVGTSTHRTQVQANVGIGFKFYDTTLAKVQRWNGSSWDDL